jgi:hypothetical protein
LDHANDDRALTTGILRQNKLRRGVTAQPEPFPHGLRKFDIDLILARHGNTFDDGQQTVWVGAQIDLPLASKGREQAKANR